LAYDGSALQEGLEKTYPWIYDEVVRERRAGGAQAVTVA
jgi:hypothetical protein